ncbi:MAG: NfeD family protein [Betaproteobacteria bacterium]|nr:NfeD family protein [Betaproteobacteria bacterium]
MSTPMQWWIAAALLVALELTSGTFYLLMLAVGAVAGAMAAHLGLNVPLQWVSSALVGTGSVYALYSMRKKRFKPAPGANRDINLDIGSVVQVDAWDNHGEARIRYRGSDWQARFGGKGPLQSGQFRIKALDGNTLVLEPLAGDAAAHARAQSETHPS